ncbi:MAG TPA: SIS domain-containing protein [Chitinispirillaceae bacterium]|nr:SIS domain-containing protein [Chitinispirillaceae bacterium]
MKEAVMAIFDNLFVRYPALQSVSDPIRASFDALKKCYMSGGKVLACGNGGSASDSEHLIGELMKKFGRKRPVPPEFRQRLKSLGIESADYLADKLEMPLAAISLVSQTALITAIANDVSADMIFAQQVLGYGKPGDILFAFSTSGNSANVVNAVNVALACGMITIGFTGEHGGTLRDICDIAVRVPASQTYQIQEFHFPIYHSLCLMIEEEVFGT